jgi:predicted dehydrogenase
MNAPFASLSPVQAVADRPRLAFLGLGWIGRLRLSAMAENGLAEIAAVADPSPDALDEAKALAPSAACGMSLEDLLGTEPDGLVIATPSALHAEQAEQALRRGIAVFCQKPLARTAGEARRVVAAARDADRPLGVDYSYRHVDGVDAMRGLIRTGALGHIHAVELVFHNAYGPDKAWFRSLEQAGGGCLMDLGSHLLDLVLWCLPNVRVEELRSRLFAGGRRLSPPPVCVEDFAALDLDLGGGTAVRLDCSWNLHAGCDVIIAARFYGTDGAAVLRNTGGSYYDFVVERLQGTAREVLAKDQGTWGGRALAAWTRRLAAGEGYDAGEDPALVPVLLDRAYGRNDPDGRPDPCAY